MARVRSPGVQSRASTRATPTIEARSVTAPGLVSQTGGIIGGWNPLAPVLIASASRRTVSMTIGGGRFPATPSVVAACDIWLLAFSAAIRRMVVRFRPAATARALSSSS